MDWFGIALIIAIAAPMFGFWVFLIVKPKIRGKTNKKWLLYICDATLVIGISIYVSFLMCVTIGKHHNSIVEYTEYPIQKLTFSSVYFNDRGGDNFNESWVILENPNDKYQNVVVAETEYFTLQWLFKIKTEASKYHVYLSEEVYSRFQEGDVIYKLEK